LLIGIVPTPDQNIAQSTFSITLGRFLYSRAYWLYQPLYAIFKRRQDKHEIELFNRLVKKGDTVLDIGANIGFYSKLFSTLVGETGIVHAFEPDRTNFQHLTSFTQTCRNLNRYQKAVSHKTEVIRIYTSKLLNVDHRTYPIDDYENCYEIEAIALDDWLERLPTIHLIKMDIQGYELRAMEGMRQLIKRDAPILFLEFWPQGLNAARTDPREFLKHLSSSGYDIKMMTEQELVPFQDSIIPELEAKGIYGFVNLLLIRQ
jgi:FkbM family methyltransferase